MISRRNLLAVSGLGVAATVSAAKGASFGNPDEPAQGAINGKGPGNLTDPGPRNDVIGSQFPSAQSPPATDVGGMPTTWASFNNAAKRIQNGGWAREVTVEDFAVSKEISGVNMRLTAGGIRELHWHQAAEWAIMTYGNCRVTVLDAEGRPFVGDVKAGDLWYFPAGAPHSLQGLGPDGCEFVICFDDGHADEFNTLLVTDWLAHTPPSVLAKNFGVPAETFAKIPLHNLWIFQGTVPGDLAADRAAIQKDAPAPTHPGCRQHKFQGLNRGSRGPRYYSTGRCARDALAPECGRVAVLHQGQGAHDGIQHRPERAHYGFHRWRHWLCQTQLRALCRKHRRYRSSIRRGVSCSPLRGSLAFQLACAYATETGGSAPQRRRGNDRQVAWRCSGCNAKVHIDDASRPAEASTRAAARRRPLTRSLRADLAENRTHGGLSRRFLVNRDGRFIGPWRTCEFERTSSTGERCLSAEAGNGPTPRTEHLPSVHETSINGIKA